MTDIPTGPVVPSFRALSGRLELTVRRHKFNKDILDRIIVKLGPKSLDGPLCGVSLHAKTFNLKNFLTMKFTTLHNPY